MTHGGKRRGAGRPKGSGKYKEPTVPIRCPVSMVTDVYQFMEELYDERQKNVAIKNEQEYGSNKGEEQ